MSDSKESFMNHIKESFMNHIPEPWERQPNESSRAFEAFAVYRDMGAERSYAKTSQKLGKNKTTIDQWGRNNQWVSRIAAWDDEQDRLTREALVKGITAMRKNHVDMAEAMLIKATEALERLPVDEMNMADIARAVDVASKLERLSRGEPTERTESRNDASGGVTIYLPEKDDLSNLSTDELRQLESIMGKLNPPN